jgi:hypothetical protein
MKLKLGLEVEFFGFQKGKPLDMRKNDIPCDNFSILAEARGNPFDSAYQAVYSAMGEIQKIKDLMKSKKIRPVFNDFLEKDAHVKYLISEMLPYTKGRLRSRNFVESVKEKSDDVITAGLHISFTNPIVVVNKNNYPETVNELFDFLELFKRIEDEFYREIADSGRAFGQYEVKNDGRVEYRSLPATLIHKKDFATRLNDVVTKFKG